MNKELTLYFYHNSNPNRVRTIEIEETLYFIAKDICCILGIINTSDAMSRLDDDEKGVVSTDTLGGNQAMAAVTEGGLYSLIMQSRKPEAKPFQKWVTNEVLPSIRKTGQYQVKQLTPAQQLLVQAQLMVDIEAKLSIVQGEMRELKDILSEEPQENWQETMSGEVRRMCQKYALNFQDEFSEIYKRIESLCCVDLQDRVTRKKGRMKLSGAKAEQINRVNKLNVIADDPKLKVAFESVLKKRKIKHLEEGRDLKAVQ